MKKSIKVYVSILIITMLLFTGCQTQKDDSLVKMTNSTETNQSQKEPVATVESDSQSETPVTPDDTHIKESEKTDESDSNDSIDVPSDVEGVPATEVPDEEATPVSKDKGDKKEDVKEQELVKEQEPVKEEPAKEQEPTEEVPIDAVEPTDPAEYDDGYIQDLPPDDYSDLTKLTPKELKALLNMYYEGMEFFNDELPKKYVTEMLYGYLMTQHGINEFDNYYRTSEKVLSSSTVEMDITAMLMDGSTIKHRIQMTMDKKLNWSVTKDEILTP